MKNLKFLILFCSLVLIISKAQCYPRLISHKEDLSSDLELLIKNQQPYDDNIFFYQEIAIDTDIFISSDTIEIQLDGENVVVFKKYTFNDEGIDYLYKAYESENVTAAISKYGSHFQGIIHSASGTYNVETFGEKYVLEKVNMDGVEDDTEPVFSEKEMPSNTSVRNESYDTAYIRVLIMCTPEASLVFSSEEMMSKLYNEINHANTSFYNSNIRAKFELAYIGKTIDQDLAYTFDELLYKYKNTQDGVFDEVHALRNRYSADVCVLYAYETTSLCGKGYINASASEAFSVVKAATSCINRFTLAHEIGHNVGCRHDTFTDANNTPYPYGHGYVNYISGDHENSWRTIMANENACASSDNFCRRIQYWSNPDISINGAPTGNTESCNNARVWNENSINVSYFRNDPEYLHITNSDNSALMKYSHWKANQTIVADSGYVVESGQVVKMSATNSIVLGPNTKINAGAKFYATNIVDNYSSNCPQFLSKNQNPVRHEVSPQQTPVIILSNIEASGVTLSLDLKKEKQCVSISIFDIAGQLRQQVIQSEYLQEGTITYPINVNTFSNGIFFVIVNIDDITYINKFIK